MVVTLPLLIVIFGIFAIALMSTLSPARQVNQVEENIKRASDQQIKQDMSELQSALELYLADHQSYPKDLSSLTPKYIKETPSAYGNKPYNYILISPTKYTLSTQLSDGTTYTISSP